MSVAFEDALAAEAGDDDVGDFAHGGLDA